MNAATIFVMLIWSGGSHGGPTAIPGFASLAACEHAKAEVVEFYKTTNWSLIGPVAACKAFGAGVEGAP